MHLFSKMLILIALQVEKNAVVFFAKLVFTHS